jgi:hypothetical protein
MSILDCYLSKYAILNNVVITIWILIKLRFYLLHNSRLLGHKGHLSNRVIEIWITQKKDKKQM